MRTTKQSVESSRRGRLVRKNAEDIQRYLRSPKFQRELARSKARGPDPTKEDLADLPELTDEELALFRPVKQAVTTRIDADVLFWLKSNPGRYQSTLNAELRKAMEREKAAAAPRTKASR